MLSKSQCLGHSKKLLLPGGMYLRIETTFRHDCPADVDLES